MASRARAVETDEIRRLHFEESVPKRELARRFGRDIKTIRRILDADGRKSPSVRRSRGKRLDRFRDEIVALLVADPEISAPQVAKALSDRAGDLSQRTIRSFLAELRASGDLPRAGTGGGAPAPGRAEPPVDDGDEDEDELDDIVDSRPPPEATPTTSADAPPLAAAYTPADPTPLPDVGDDGTHDLSDPAYYLNRELTWLNFNYRVLHEAEDPRTPLLERVKFIAITGSNLDEFVMKRIGGLKRQVGRRHATSSRSMAALREQQIEECLGSACSELVQPSNAHALDAGKLTTRLGSRRRHRCWRAWAASSTTTIGAIRAPRSLLPEGDLPARHAAGHRPGAPVPLRLEPLAEPARASVRLRRDDPTSR